VEKIQEQMLSNEPTKCLFSNSPEVVVNSMEGNGPAREPTGFCSGGTEGLEITQKRKMTNTARIIMLSNDKG